ncbi:exocyst complex component 2 [Leptidea sinapis]|uniref:exocyst complex component 2 n=1 Tax=Leptidea sinapis TaxID=189913 RepID=UPI0021457260|nr:exocyst complex component 2 [Leptidea sinapis]XP_050665878.1 exocyst complex component 2 [Leptidea sinapis]
MGPPPVVTGISPKEGPPGTRVTIRGEFLGISATDLVGLKICGCDCLLSAEWKSINKIVARSGPCKGRGDIIVSTRSGGEGTSTVQFRGYHESIGPVKESAVWVEEAAPPPLPWGRRPMSPTAYTPPDPLGLSTEGDECKFPEEDLNELFPEGSGKLSDENFQPGWYLLEHHSNTSFEDLKAGMVFLQRKVESQKEGQLSFLKANTGAVMDQLDRLVLLKNMYEEDHRKNGKEPLPSLQAAIEESISLADSLFSEILSRKANADKTREALSLLTRHKFLFQLPASIDKNIRKKEYDLVVNDYTRVKNLFGNTDVKLFQKILDEVDKKIEELKDNLYKRIKSMPCNVQEQTKYIRLLISLNWEGDAAWVAITTRKEYLMSLMNKVRDHFKQKEEQENGEKGKRRGRDAVGGESDTCAVRSAWCACASGALAGELHALWPLARRYFAGDLAGEPNEPRRHAELKEMIIAAVELFSEHMRACLLSSGSSSNMGLEATRSRLLSNLRHLREAYESLIKLDLPSQPLSIVEKVIFEYRVHGMTLFLQRAHKQVKSLADRETWKIVQYSDYGAITNLPSLLETTMEECLSSIHKCVLASGRRESPLLAEGSEPLNILQKHTQQILLAFVSVVEKLALHSEDADFNHSSLSVALEQALEEAEGGARTWQQRLLISAANAQYTRRVTLNNIAAVFDSNGFPKPTLALTTTKEALSNLESSIAETYLEQKGDPLVDTIEPSMYMGRSKIDPDTLVDDARPYVYEIINNLIAVHAEVDSICGCGSSRYVRDICEIVCEEVARLSACVAPHSRATAFRARLECGLLRLATANHLTRKAENYLAQSLSGLPPLDNADDKKHLETAMQRFKKRMELQLVSLNCNVETV